MKAQMLKHCELLRDLKWLIHILSTGNQGGEVLVTSVSKKTMEVHRSRSFLRKMS